MDATTPAHMLERQAAVNAVLGNMQPLQVHDHPPIDLGKILKHSQTSRTNVALTAAVCSPELQAVNDLAISRYGDLQAAAIALRQAVEPVDGTWNSCTEIWRHVEEYNRHTGYIDIALCEPSFSLVAAAEDRWHELARDALVSLDKAMRTIYSNMERELGNLSGEASRVHVARQAFETSRSGGGGTTAISNAHQSFEDQYRVCATFALMDFTALDHTRFTGAVLYNRLYEIRTAEAKDSTITELDRLRQEYVDYARERVPAADEFTNNTFGRYVTWANLNTGSFSWALIRQVLIDKIDTIVPSLWANGYPVQFNSIYRNPARADSNSRHQFGDAVDFQTFPIGHAGGYTSADWTILRGITDTAGPSYTEPMAQSGAGHVHVDWRFEPGAPSDGGHAQ